MADQGELAALTQLREQLVRCFNLDELRTLSVDADVDYEEIGETAKTPFCRELLLLLQRRGMLGNLVKYLPEQRPNIDWAALVGPILGTERTRQVLAGRLPLFHLPVVISIGPGEATFLKMWRDARATMEARGLLAPDSLPWALTEPALSLKCGMLPPDPSLWQLQVRDFFTLVQRLTSQREARVALHLFANAPTALMMGLGAQLSRNYLVTLYSYRGEAEDEPYVPVLSGTGLHIRRTELRHITVSPIPERLTRDVVVALNLSLNSPWPEACDLAEERGWSAIRVSGQYDLEPAEGAWLPTVQEVVSTLRMLREEGARRLHLFLDSRLPMSMAIGMALGNMVPTTVYHRHQETRGGEVTHLPILQLEQLVRHGDAG